jgi:hypothetical protein
MSNWEARISVKISGSLPLRSVSGLEKEAVAVELFLRVAATATKIPLFT